MIGFFSRLGMLPISTKHRPNCPHSKKKVRHLESPDKLVPTGEVGKSNNIQVRGGVKNFEIPTNLDISSFYNEMAICSRHGACCETVEDEPSSK